MGGVELGSCCIMTGVHLDICFVIPFRRTKLQWILLSAVQLSHIAGGFVRNLPHHWWWMTASAGVARRHGFNESWQQEGEERLSWTGRKNWWGKRERSVFRRLFTVCSGRELTMKQRFRTYSSGSVSRDGVFIHGSGYHGGVGVVEYRKGSVSCTHEG